MHIKISNQDIHKNVGCIKGREYSITVKSLDINLNEKLNLERAD